jgi:hypothetical protein
MPKTALEQNRFQTLRLPDSGEQGWFRMRVLRRSGRRTVTDDCDGKGLKLTLRG